MFPDYVTPANAAFASYAGPWFVLSQDYPTSAPSGDAPWLAHDFAAGVAGANAYLYALRDYAFEGMIAADFVPKDNVVRPWFHMPMMNFGGGRREYVHGLTRERQVTGPELGLKTGVTIHNYAIGFYNAAGAATIGAVWKSGSPDITKSQFADGTMTFKILFSDAVESDYPNASDYPLTDAPEWTMATPGGPTKVRLMQMDVAAVDARSTLTRWVFGTFAFDKTATDASPWNRLRPVGLSWGNDPGYTPADQSAGQPLTETIISDEAPAYAAGHLGWAGRTNGPVDNPISGCISCHGTAQFPVAADLAPFNASCTTDAMKLHWFRDFQGDTAFGAVKRDTCTPFSVSPEPIPLDFSLQMQVAVQSTLQFNDVNPCEPPAPAVLAAPAPVPEMSSLFADAPRIER